MLLPACTGFGDATFVTDRFGPVVPTIVLVVAVLFAELGSMAEELAETVPAITDPLAVPLFTLTTSVNVPDVDPGRLAFVQTTLPALPTLGVRQLHPAGATRDTNVVLVGTGVTSVALSAALGPVLVKTWV